MQTKSVEAQSVVGNCCRKKVYLSVKPWILETMWNINDLHEIETVV